MQVRTIVILSIAILILAGCSISSDLYSSWKPNLPKGTILKSSSRYWSKSESTYHSLWDKLMYLNNLNRKESIDTFENSWVKLNFIKPDTLNAYHFNGEKILDSITIVGRIEGNYFVSNQSHKSVFIPLLYYKNLNTQYVLYQDSLENLALQSLEWNAGAIFLFAADGGGQSTSLYMKKN